MSNMSEHSIDTRNEGSIYIDVLAHKIACAAAAQRMDHWKNQALSDQFYDLVTEWLSAVEALEICQRMDKPIRAAHRTLGLAIADEYVKDSSNYERLSHMRKQYVLLTEMKDKL